jgi:hypothetical protein
MVQADCGDLLKRLLAYPVSMSASNYFEQSLLTHKGLSRFLKGDIQR